MKCFLAPSKSVDATHFNSPLVVEKTAFELHFLNDVFRDFDPHKGTLAASSLWGRSGRLFEIARAGAPVGLAVPCPNPFWFLTSFNIDLCDASAAISYAKWR